MSRSAKPLAAGLAAASLFTAVVLAQTIPRTWDEKALSTGQVPPPVAAATIKPVPAAYYYRMRERVMYRRYPVYSSKAEPPEYLQKLALVEPEITFDPVKLGSEQDWITAGREVFRYPISLFPIQMLETFRGILDRSHVPSSSRWYLSTSQPCCGKEGCRHGWLSLVRDLPHANPAGWLPNRRRAGHHARPAARLPA
jgi:hypothetical protein